MSEIGLGQRMNLVSDIRRILLPRPNQRRFFSLQNVIYHIFWISFNCHGQDNKFWKYLSPKACIIPTEFLCNT